MGRSYGSHIFAVNAPDLRRVLAAAQRAGLSHVNLDGVVIPTDRVAAPDPNGADLWWSGKYKHHGGNVQVISAPDGWPLWTSEVRPGREHDMTCARTHGVIDALADFRADLIGLAHRRHHLRRPRSTPPGERPYGLKITHSDQELQRECPV
ncbi:hypothetical protein Airi01_072960 [Actinoallomurus iriomotensis]|uniref:DDE Tnp4 domain-containing protein n=1 Tax=Actinoallomurus iriomotensis TaxID=478107 RepID=A0A9W6VTD8_9ACTN|nr:hypothetical protein Airi01_072960 [Actinoallomurus iriomotensis]